MMHFTEIADYSKVPVVMYEHPELLEYPWV